MQKKLIVALLVGVSQGLVVALACHALGLDAHGWAIVPLLVGAAAGVYVFRSSSS